MNQVNQQLLSSVTGALLMITEELSKPQEDVVAFSVCGTTRHAIENVLKLYLESKSVDSKQAGNMDELVGLCIRQDERFRKFNFSAVNCRCEPNSNNVLSYCIGEEKVHSCYKLLVELKEFIFDDLKISTNA